MYRVSPLGCLAIAALLAGAVGCAPDDGTGDEPVAGRAEALGEPQDGFPNWHERVIYVWSNRARSDPAADLASCTQCAEASCYAPVQPLVWSHNLARAARFHSANLVLSSCGLQHDSPCTLQSDIGTRYTPGPCDGSPSCACTDMPSCGASRTGWSARVSAFGTSPRAENIARGISDPVPLFYLWLHERDTNSACGYRTANGHRFNILAADRRAIGVGQHATTYTQDFGGSGTPSGLVAGVHYPQTGSTIEFRANWYSTAGPTTALVNVDGTCHPMSIERGSATNGTYLATVSGIASGCRRYFFQFETASGTQFYPTTGSFGIGCTTDYASTRPAVCGVCTPMCAGRACGDDGCGGSCGTCSGGATCNASGACVCPAGQTMCSGTCVDTQSSTSHCGMCGRACAAGQSCVAGTCMSMCTRDCSGRTCGDDGCGGSCGTCASPRVCGATGTCVCGGGLTDCAGACVDTSTSRTNCGACGTTCGMGEVCTAGVCTCVPSCAGRTCGDDGCGGSCGTCAADRVCASGACECGAGLVECGGACVDTRVDEANCGACAAACGAGETCTAGACAAAMPDAGCMPACTGRDCGDDTCGGSCGACGAGQVCAGGGACACAGEATLCDGACVDVRESTAHCGACGAACAPGQACIAGVCSGETDGGTGDGGTGDGGARPDGGLPADGAGGSGAGETPLEGGCGACRVAGTGRPSRSSGALFAVVAAALVTRLARRRTKR